MAEEEAERVCAEVDLALDWKWSYADGDLGWWRSEHVGEFLLEWCPRKLSVFGDDAESTPSSLASFVAFLADAGLLAAGSSPLGELQQVAAAATSSSAGSGAAPPPDGRCRERPPPCWPCSPSWPPSWVPAGG